MSLWRAPLDIELVHSIHEIGAGPWNRLRRDAVPFTRFEFLSALEDSGCTNAENGWHPSHLLVKEGQQLVAVMPLYLKTHSYGEYVFDWSWADAYRRHGLDYYPKLLNAIPFTPASGPRLLHQQGIDTDRVWNVIHGYLQNICRKQAISGYHTLFPDAETRQHWGPHYLLRTGCQFHWQNEGYRDFDDFLAHFNSRKRKSVRKERRGVLESGVELQRATGDEISEGDWETFYRFYHATYLKRSGNSGYLNRTFFRSIAQAMGDQVLMVKALRGESMVAAALCFFDQTNLYGRYWGCFEETPGLHFEACYYQGIEFAIERGIQTFDPGAQGEHKIQRGFRPTLTYSGHWLSHPQFSSAIEDFLQRESEGVHAYRDDCATYLPFRQAD